MFIHQRVRKLRKLSSKWLRNVLSADIFKESRSCERSLPSELAKCGVCQLARLINFKTSHITINLLQYVRLNITLKKSHISIISTRDKYAQHNLPPYAIQSVSPRILNDILRIHHRNLRRRSNRLRFEYPPKASL